ncbi:GNAT family N-acetyltransferase [Alteromonadaceae bacterium BrNp21-10]|nr:GNAT family N-acetyltransferase [Alteromonadaceae bacterium BrNp21-10]
MNHYSTLNIENMTQLWTAYGAVNEGDFKVNNSWPHRIWLGDKNGKDDANRLIHLPWATPNHILASWDVNASLQLDLAVHWQKNNQLFLMWLAMKDYVVTVKNDSATELVQIASNNVDSISKFVALCSEGFDYPIDESVIQNVAHNPKVNLYVLYSDNVPVATTLLYQQNEVMGIYQVAVPQQYRGQGLAKKMMLAILNNAKQSNVATVVLQSSTMGYELYRQLGFCKSGILNLYQKNV